MPSKSISVLLCHSGFRSSATFDLRCHGPKSDFIGVNYLDWEFNFATKITVNIFFNNRLSGDIVRRESVTGFKKCQRTN